MEYDSIGLIFNHCAVRQCLEEVSEKNQILSSHVDRLEKSLKSRSEDLMSKDQEIKLLKARLLESIKKR